MSATREVESVILGNLKPSTRYGVIIQAKTNAGIGPASSGPLCSTLDEGMFGILPLFLIMIPVQYQVIYRDW